LKKNILLSVLLLAMHVAAGGEHGVLRGLAVDWPAFMKQHDMTFEKLPGSWKDAPHFGNAMVGSMLYQVDNTLRLQIFRTDVQDHRDDTWGWTAYSRPRLVIGYFSLVPVGKLKGCSWHKNLWNAELTGTITTDKGTFQLRHFVHAEDMAIVTELTPSVGEKGFTWTWHPAPAKSTRSGYPVDAAGIERFAKSYGSHLKEILKVAKPNPEGRLEKNADVSVWVQDLLVGGQYATAWAEQTSGDIRTHIATIANSYPAATAAETAVSDVSRSIGRRFTVMAVQRAPAERWWIRQESGSKVLSGPTSPPTGTSNQPTGQSTPPTGLSRARRL
jgi:alpha-L-fucosidase 2